jgi:DNA-binding FadR family transcriptional regulator
LVQIGSKRQGRQPAGTNGETAMEPPAAVTTGSAAIAVQLRRAILDGAYDYRERLPSERELADHFGASRSTIREALSQLEDMHLVSRRIGSGTFVTHDAEFGGTNIAEVTSPLELIEARFAFEPHMTKLAVVNATARELDQMSVILERLEACGGDQELFSREDEAYHLALAECTRNPLMVWLYRRINYVRGHKQWNAMKDTVLTPARIDQYNQQHRALYEALKSRDMDGALQIITAHLEKARADLLGAGRHRHSGGE